MKLQKAIDLGKPLGLYTVQSCVDNVFFNSLRYIDYNHVWEELRELKEEEKQYNEGRLEITL